MNKIKKIFGGINMTWKKVILFAIIAGVYTGIINQIPFLEDTSFRDIAISYEVWILFAVIIVTNCKKPIEAALKCFIFFLISQPLVYIVELPTLGHFPWNYYKYWFILTILTLPGGFIAYYSKKDNIIGTLIMSVANIMLVFLAFSNIKQMINSFPHHLLSVIFCFTIIIIFIINLQTKKSNRIIGFLLAIISTLIFLIITFGNLGGVFSSVNAISQFSLDENETWNCSLVDKSFGTVKVTNGYLVSVNMKKMGKTSLICTDSSNNNVKYNLSLDSSNIINYTEEK